MITGGEAIQTDAAPISQHYDDGIAVDVDAEVEVDVDDDVDAGDCDDNEDNSGGYRWGSITEGMLRQLLSSSRLRIVNLQLVNSLTDELFKVNPEYQKMPSQIPNKPSQIPKTIPNTKYTTTNIQTPSQIQKEYYLKLQSGQLNH